MAVLKILELVGTSKESWSDAAREAVNEAAKTVRGIETVEVVHSRAVVQNNRLTEYQVQVRIGFRIERSAGAAAKKKAEGKRPSCCEASLAQRCPRACSCLPGSRSRRAPSRLTGCGIQPPRGRPRRGRRKISSSSRMERRPATPPQRRCSTAPRRTTRRPRSGLAA